MVEASERRRWRRREDRKKRVAGQGTEKACSRKRVLGRQLKLCCALAYSRARCVNCRGAACYKSINCINDLKIYLIYKVEKNSIALNTELLIID